MSSPVPPSASGGGTTPEAPTYPVSVVYRKGWPTAADYREAVHALLEASTQLEPDGDGCHVCGDNDHQAFQCHHNPLVMAREAAAIRDATLWRCFHCGVLFANEEAARQHFGKAEEEIASCLQSGVRREAAAQALEEAAEAADAGSWGELEYRHLNGPVDSDACDAIVDWLRARAVSLRQVPNG